MVKTLAVTSTLTNKNSTKDDCFVDKLKHKTRFVHLPFYACFITYIIFQFIRFLKSLKYYREEFSHLKISG